jgi:RNA polymerase sigma-70 factor, ECF subfamily
MSDTPDLSSLAARIAAGDRIAENEIVVHFAPRIRAMAVVRTRDPDLARDLTQDTLLAVLQAMRKGQVRDGDRIEGFVAGVTRNVINNYRRRSLRHPESPLDEDTPAIAVDDDRDGPERRRLMARALAELTPADRQILLLTLVEGLKPGEIAHKIGVSADVARTRKSRALKRILEAIDARLRARSRNAAGGHLL